MQNELLSEGLTLMLAGMGTVFVFLTVLVMAMTLMSRLARLLQSASVATTAAPAGAGPTGADDEIAAIAAAIAEHRRT